MALPPLLPPLLLCLLRPVLLLPFCSCCRPSFRRYIAFTAAIQPQDAFCRTYEPEFGSIKFGSCASVGFKYKHANEPGRRITWAGYPHGENPSFYPSTVFINTCIQGCGCCTEKGMLYNPGTVPACAAGTALPSCDDGPNPYDPHAPPLKHEWCGVCGPMLNEPRFIDFYFAHKVQNACEPRNATEPSPVCAASTTRLGCFAHPLKCEWRVPKQAGTCGVKGCCSIFSSGPTCNWDCALCQSASPSVDPTNSGIPGLDQESFDACCDKCEFCSATGNGTIATEATCGQPEDIRVKCHWNSTNSTQAVAGPGLVDPLPHYRTAAASSLG